MAQSIAHLRSTSRVPADRQPPAKPARSQKSGVSIDRANDRDGQEESLSAPLATVLHPFIRPIGLSRRAAGPQPKAKGGWWRSAAMPQLCRSCPADSRRRLACSAAQRKKGAGSAPDPFVGWDRSSHADWQLVLARRSAATETGVHRRIEAGRVPLVSAPGRWKPYSGGRGSNVISAPDAFPYAGFTRLLPYLGPAGRAVPDNLMT